MSAPIFSIVDIETTGGHRYGNRITEIAILKVQDGQIIDEYETLINPERSIPSSISQFTGITNAMVASAPKFYEVAKRIVELTKDTIFVAHNVYFDFNFVKSEFSSLGYVFQLPKLCTVRAARKILPGHSSYSLGNLCRDLGIPITSRHRAMGDARATVELFRILQEKEPQLHITISDSEKKVSFPPHLDPSEYERLPTLPGIYSFWDDKGALLYIGKSINIKKRVASHFRINIAKAKERELKGAIHKITFEVLGNDLCAKLVECDQIKKQRPRFNRSMNRARFRYGLVWLPDMFGYCSPQFYFIQFSRGRCHSSHKSKSSTKKNCSYLSDSFWHRGGYFVF